ncbi:MAG: Com family DNA-binding transcriptional regulator [Taibaiella sp.]|nr:Com family DNA-binding transcriptional regulator [Taibaiella sp.]
MTVIRCSKCNKIIGEAEAGAKVRLKCKCGTVNTIELPAPVKFSAKQAEVTKEARA